MKFNVNEYLLPTRLVKWGKEIESFFFFYFSVFPGMCMKYEEN